RQIANGLSVKGFSTEYTPSDAEALQLLRMRQFGVVVTSPRSTIDKDLSLLEEMRLIRPGLKCIVLANQTTPEGVIAALRAKVVACFAPPFNLIEILNIIGEATADTEWEGDIEVLSAKPGWVSVQANCQLLSAERLMTFENELNAQI